MSDVATILSSVRAKLAVLAGRRDQIQSQLADIDREHGRLGAAVSVMEEHLQDRQGSSASDVPPGSRSLSDQILDALAGSPGKTRADLLRVFGAGVNENTFGSAIGRLRKRGAVVKRGRYYSRVAQGPPSGAFLSPGDVTSARSDVDRSLSDVDPVPVEVDQAVAASAPSGPGLATGGAASSPLPSESGTTTYKARVLDAVATSAACTRAALVKFLGSQGVKESSVDTAIAGLKKDGVLEQRADRVLVVPPRADAPAAPPGASSGSS